MSDGELIRLKPTMDPDRVSRETLPARPLEDRVHELERAVAILLLEPSSPAPAVAFSVGIPMRLPTVEELEYATWVFLCFAAACAAVKWGLL